MFFFGPHHWVFADLQGAGHFFGPHHWPGDQQNHRES